MHPLVLGKFPRGSNDNNIVPRASGNYNLKMVLHNRNLNNSLKSSLFNKNTLSLHL